MTDAVKKTTKKASTKSKAPAKSAKTTAATNGAASKTNGTASNVTEIWASHDQIAMLAHKYWAERGRQHGHHEEDWYRAEQELRGKAS